MLFLTHTDRTICTNSESKGENLSYIGLILKKKSPQHACLRRPAPDKHSLSEGTSRLVYLAYQTSTRPSTWPPGWAAWTEPRLEATRDDLRISSLDAAAGASTLLPAPNPCQKRVRKRARAQNQEKECDCECNRDDCQTSADVCLDYAVCVDL